MSVDDPATQSRMQVGITVPGSAPDAVRRMVGMEQLGFDYLACGEHMMFGVPSQNALITLSVAAA